MVLMYSILSLTPDVVFLCLPLSFSYLTSGNTKESIQCKCEKLEQQFNKIEVYYVFYSTALQCDKSSPSVPHTESLISVYTKKKKQKKTDASLWCEACSFFAVK